MCKRDTSPSNASSPRPIKGTGKRLTVYYTTVTVILVVPQIMPLALGALCIVFHVFPEDYRKPREAVFADDLDDHGFLSAEAHAAIVAASTLLAAFRPFGFEGFEGFFGLSQTLV
jgi:hypothetical protein